MKKFNDYINEKLVITKDTKSKSIVVHDKFEFKKAVDDIIKQTGNSETVDLNSIDVSHLVDMTRLLRTYKTIKHLDISDWDVSQIKNMGFMFPPSLETVDLSRWNVSEVQNMAGMFMSCNNLKEVGNISKWETKSLENTNDMFSDCISIKNVDISGWDFSKLRQIDRMFYNCRELESIGNITKEYLTKLTPYSRDTFFFCKKLKK